MSYQANKEKTRRKAQALQVNQEAMSWADVAEQGAQLEKAAKRYGLIKEFKREGVL